MNKFSRIALSALALAATLAVSGCGSKKPVLNVYTWSDYMAPEVVKEFEQRFNCKVQMNYFDSNEAMYAKFKNGARGYDVIFPSSYMVKLMDEQGMLRKLDKSLLPNTANVDGRYLSLAFDKEMDHSVPYMITVTCLAYTPAAGEVEANYSQFERADLAGRMTLLNDLREVIGAALKHNGHSLNSVDDAELAEAKQTILGWKKNIATFENEQYKIGLASGEFLLVQGYSGDLMQVQDENEDIRIVVPEEGSALSFDDMVIPVDAPNPELAHAFINFLYDPEISAKNTEYVFYLCPNRASYELLGEETRANPILFPSEETVAKLEMIADLGEDNAKYNKLWDEIKAAE
jgi:spermidine/putrescine transport system substrate-binding protein